MIQALFIFFMKALSGNAGLTIVAISLVVNTLLLPIYTVADRWQTEERDLLKRMKGKVADIRAVFRGDTRQMILNTYHRQMGYHPVFSIRSSIGLLIQIPFFLAAYDFLSHSSALHGVSFLFLRDLSQPDSLLTVGGVSINLLPFLMTAINLISAFLYTQGLQTKDKVQLFLLAAVFLVLLYSSPSGLVLYWTISNFFSLGKNASRSLKRPGRAFQWFLLAGVAAVVILPASGLGGPFRVKMVGIGLGLLAVMMVVPWAWRRLMTWGTQRPGLDPQKGDREILILGWANLAVLAGLVVPALLIGSSPTEFYGVWPLLFQTALQSVSLFLLIPLAFWTLANPALKRWLAPASLVILLWALVDCFAFPTSGVMNRTFDFTTDNAVRSRWDWLTSPLALVLAMGGAAAVWRFAKRSWIRSGLILSMTALAATGLVTLVAVGQSPAPSPPVQKAALEPVFHVSPTQPNLFVVFLDRAVGAALPGILAKDPGLRSELDGFVYYPNTLSFGQCTILGAPELFGGYEYTPDAINARVGEPLVQKFNEALKVLPAVFGHAGYRVTFSDPSYANLQLDPPDVGIFRGMENVTALNLKGNYTDLFLKEFGLQQAQLPEHQRFDYDILERFSLFRIAPPFLRYYLYRNGVWWHANKVNNTFETIMNSYSNLYFLPGLTTVDSIQPTLNILVNETTHADGSFGADFKPTPWEIEVPPEDLNRFGNEVDSITAYNLGACLKALVPWFQKLKSAGVWDKTKIVIVADHGMSFGGGVFSDREFARFNPLLLVKDFGDTGGLATSPSFMSNADVPAILAQALGGAVNPATGKRLTSEGKNGKLFVHDAFPSPSGHRPDGFNFQHNWELTEKSVFTKDGWKVLP